MSRKKIAKKYPFTTMHHDRQYGCINLPLGTRNANGKPAYKTERSPMPIECPGEAASWALARRAQWLSGEGSTPVVGNKKNMTFAVLAAWYKEEFLIEPIYQNGGKVEGLRSWKADRSKLAALTKYFGHYRLDSITIDVLRKFKRNRLTGKAKEMSDEPVSITTVNRDFAQMRRMFKKATNREWMKKNPFDNNDEKLINVALEAPNNKKMTPRIAARLLARSRKCQNPLFHYVLLTLRHTGARPSEIFPFHKTADDDMPREPLTWGRILEHDFKAVTLVSYKGQKRVMRVVPTSIELERGLRKLYVNSPNAQPEDILFPVTSFQTAWETLCRSARIEGVVMRDFRAFFNTELANNPNIDEASRLMMLGHTTVQMNRHYITPSPEFISNYRRRIGGEFAQVEMASAAVN